MANWTAVSKSQHAQSGYRPRMGYQHAAQQIVTPVLLAELPKLISQFVLGFVVSNQRYQLVALLGVDERHNLYVQPDGRWLARYVPATIRSYPFNLATDAQGRKVLCIDADQLGDGGADQQRLFGEAGEPSPSVKSYLEFLNQCDADRQRIEQAVDTLSAAGLMASWSLTVGHDQGVEPRQVEGLYRVDEQALNQLGADDYAALQGAPMAVAHAQLFSMHQQHQLTDRLKKQPATGHPLSDWLAGGNDEKLQFDI